MISQSRQDAEKAMKKTMVGSSSESRWYRDERIENGLKKEKPPRLKGSKKTMELTTKAPRLKEGIGI